MIEALPLPILQKRELPSNVPVLRGEVRLQYAHDSSIFAFQRMRVTFDGFKKRELRVRTCATGGIPIKLITQDNKVIIINVDKTSFEKRFCTTAEDGLTMIERSQIRENAYALHRTISRIAPNVSVDDLVNVLFAIRRIKKEKISCRVYNKENSDYPIPRSIIWVRGKPYLLLNHHTRGGDAKIYEQKNGKKIGYCLGLHDNKLYAVIDTARIFMLNPEIQCLEKCQKEPSHPNIVQSLGNEVCSSIKYDEDGAVEKAYLVEPLYKGDLSTVSIDDAQKLSGAAELSDALAHIHERGLVHRDIKPANIFVDKTHKLHIGDFGSASSLGRVTPEVGGTVPFISPECAKAHLEPPAPGQFEVDDPYMDRLDVYSLGCTLYEQFVGPLNEIAPFNQVLAEGESAPKEPLSLIANLENDWMAEPDAITHPIHHIIWSMVRVNPADRITAREAAHGFKALSRARDEQQALTTAENRTQLH